MIQLLTKRHCGAIGIDFGSRAFKLVQLNHDRSQIVEAVRWDLPFEAQGDTRAQLVQALRQARDGRRFKGRDAVVCLGANELFVQNIRVAKPTGNELESLVQQEVSSRLPFPAQETELRFIEAADVRQGDAMRREVIVTACHRPVLDERLQLIEDAGFRPRAVELEAGAMLRCYQQQFRRDNDRDQRSMYVHVGNSSTTVMIAKTDEVVFLKYVDIGGRHFDEALARNLKMSVPDAWALRRHNGDRRVDQQDPEVARSVNESIRATLERLISEIALCLRYHNVTFRGQQLHRVVLGGGEATQALADRMTATLTTKCELGNPLRCFDQATLPGRNTQWDVAIGLALRPNEKS
jgi:type IV pilus assembly protein PilM